MSELSQEVLQEFSDQVAEICENMQLEPDQMLDAIGSTFIGAVLSFGKTDYRVEVSGVASAMVETIFEAGE
ncbi:hypothetical protein A3752_11985 [Oleiphilus sp. HI0081]|jgi:predicted nucleic acid-binding Zn ribbon protein|uniref:hypothetical protein n=1 Tax=unclassified Oleiphilus TaxID=2631174 RepID=UPI0007C374FE|nr:MULTISPECIES: hypothetical protein [unclassified Oleiphilus]KZY91790.1 hypothetical protein A3743_06865 [Oleiphilus sp. HI0072]KZZ11319.1 hypothetical protein A3749_09230 [Oleiphilus sp. HI0078]KZZ20339.1 hypothetical protein A3752_11985 [Oleiphilus sp. HI0081]KZY30829.1 hypothetical protein A3729_10405 [Oleiphilus sp. HI0043]KZZ70793.1 hypothetical protein A3763_11715 [Oleiphilus sp. HI0128]